MDRSMSPGAFGAQLFNEVRNALYDEENKPLIVNYVYGLGGRDLPPSDVSRVFDDLLKVAREGEVKGNVVRFMGLRG